MNKKLTPKIVLIVVLVLLAALTLNPPDQKLKRGIDLAGGVSLIYEIDTLDLEESENARPDRSHHATGRPAEQPAGPPARREAPARRAPLRPPGEVTAVGRTMTVLSHTSLKPAQATAADRNQGFQLGRQGLQYGLTGGLEEEVIAREHAYRKGSAGLSLPGLECISGHLVVVF